MKRALFMVGEIGGNDYNYAFFGKKPIQEVATIVPYVVGSIITAAKVINFIHIYVYSHNIYFSYNKFVQ